jgi:hypothetical protein
MGLVKHAIWADWWVDLSGKMPVKFALLFYGSEQKPTVLFSAIFLFNFPFRK